MRKKIFYLSFLLLLLGGTVEGLKAQPGGYWTDAGNYEGFAGGNGSESSPYLIANGKQLAYLALQVNLKMPGTTTAHYRVTESFSLAEHYWVPIGIDKASSFRGTFDGNGNIITNLIVDPKHGNPHVGLFGYIDNGAVIRSVHLEKLSIVTSGATRIGGLVGISETSKITECSVMGTISGTDLIGGLVGHAVNTEIRKCYSFSTISGRRNIGGLVGDLEQGSILSGCYSVGFVSGEQATGGLAGVIRDVNDKNKSTEVRNSYTTATVIGTRAGGIGGNNVGGIVGEARLGSVLSNCFARSVRVGGAVTSSVHRVVGGAGGVLQGNYAREDMLISRNNNVNFDPLPGTDVVGLNTPNGESVPDDFPIWCEKIDEDGWICGEYPWIEYQSDPVICITSSTAQIVVEHTPVFDEMEKIVLLYQRGEKLLEELRVGSSNTDHVTAEWNKTARRLTFKPRKTSFFDFKIDSVFYAVAYEKSTPERIKTASVAVKIVITPFKEGNGTKNNPFIIETEGQLDSVRYSFTNAKYSNYKQIENLDMSKYPREFKPIGTENKKFPGSYDGNGHIIDNLVINGGTEKFQGLFGHVESNDTIQNLGLENVFITGAESVGALAGKLSAVVQNVYTTGTINATGKNVGGLLGELDKKTSAGVFSCYSSCLVKGAENVGGLIGNTGSRVMDCYATGPVFGDSYSGGLLGVVDGTSVLRCYSAGLVTGVNPGTENYAIGGFIGRISQTTVDGCYFDKITSGTNNGVGFGTASGLVALTTSNLTDNRASQYFVTSSKYDFSNFAVDFYPQLAAFSNPKFGNIQGQLNTKYASALSVVPIRFKNGEIASAIETSFDLPSKYAIDKNTNDCEIGAVVIPDATCNVTSQGKVTSVLNRPEYADTLTITPIKHPNDDEVNSKFRKICFIPRQTAPSCETIRKPEELGWLNQDVVYTLSTNAASLICGGAVFQSKIRQQNSTVDWKDIDWKDVEDEDTEGNIIHTFDKDTTVAVMYQTVSGAGINSEPKEPQPVKIDKTVPIISDISIIGNGSTKENPAKNNAKVSVSFKDELSGVASARWIIGNPKINDGSIEQLDTITPNAQGFLSVEITLPRVAGHYPFILEVTDKAGNTVNSDDVDKSVDLYVEVDDVDLDDYTLDDVTIDGNSAEEDENDPHVWLYESNCIEKETAEVVLFPSAIFGLTEPIRFTVDLPLIGDNIIEHTVVSADGKVAVTFTIHICRIIPEPATFRTLIVDGETIPLKQGQFKYTLMDDKGKIKKLPLNQIEVRADYELRTGETCDKPNPYLHPFPLGDEETVLKLAVTAADGVAKNTYEITVKRKEDPSKYVLDEVTVDGKDAEADKDDPSIWWYTDCVTKEEVLLILKPRDGWAAQVDTIVKLTKYGNNEIPITIISNDGAEVDFVINICREVAASFRTLTVDGTAIPLVPEKYDYALPYKLPKEQTQVMVEYTLRPGEECDKNTPYPYPFTGLKEGKNVLELTVTAADGVTKNIYKITVIRMSDSFLDDVTVDDEKVEPDENNPFEYTTGFCVTGDTAHVVLKLKEEFGIAVAPIDTIFRNLVYGNNQRKIEVSVTLKDNIIKTYEFIFNICREVAASFRTLTVDGTNIPLVPEKFDYALPYKLPKEQEQVVVDFTIRPDETCDKRSGESVPVAKGKNVLELTVTAADGKTKNTYKITVIRMDDNFLEEVTVDDVKVEPDENNPFVYTTDFCVVEDTAHVVLKLKEEFGIAVAPVDTIIRDLKYGNNQIKIEFSVTLKDNNIKTYVFVINICRELLAKFLTLSVDDTPIKIGGIDDSEGIMPWEGPNDTYRFGNVTKKIVKVKYTLPEGEKCNIDPRKNPGVFDPAPSGEFPFELEVGCGDPKDVLKNKNNIILDILSEDEKTTHRYIINVCYQTPDGIDPGTGGLEDDPGTGQGEENLPGPYPKDGFDAAYSLRSKCGLEDAHTLTITPQPDNARVTFTLVDENEKPIRSEKEEKDNTYTFGIANQYRLVVNVYSPEKTDSVLRKYYFDVMKRFEKNIFYQRWEDVLAVINNPANNQGYLFDDGGYDWRRTNSSGWTEIGGKLNEGKLPNEIKSYISVEPEKTYMAILTGKHTNSAGVETPIKKVVTCPCKIEPAAAVQANILAYPGVLKAGEKVTISTENISDDDLKGADVSIISPMGNTTKKVSLTGSKTLIEMPDTQGVYLLKVATKSITREFKIVLK